MKNHKKREYAQTPPPPGGGKIKSEIKIKMAI
jgi:hypothetical protein